MADLTGLFSPKRVALVGATDRDGSIGRSILENLATFDGEVVPVNPNRESVLGQRCFPAVRAAPDPDTIDLAVVAVPAEAAVEALREIGEAGIQHVVVISAGFGESGPEGQRREYELIDVTEEYDLTLVGPNCLGVISTPTGLNATFLRDQPPAGSISLVSQSGAVVAAVVAWAARHGIGYRHVVSLGNEATLAEIDVIEAFGADPDTDVILAYLEDIDEGRRFIEQAREVTRETPIVAIKAGRTAAGAAAAASHTGSIAGSRRAYDAGLAQAGVLQARTIQDVFDIGKALSGLPLPERDDVAIVTNGGGPGVLAADAVSESSLELAAFADSLSSNLVDRLPDAVEVRNPLDLIGDAGLDRYRQALDAVLEEASIGGVVVVAVSTALFEFADLAEVVSELQSEHEKPVVACLMGGEDADRAARTLDTYGIPSYFDPARAVESLAALAEYRDARGGDGEPPTTFDVDRGRAREVLDAARERDTAQIGVEAMELLDAYGIPTPDGGLAESAAEAEAIAADLGGPAVMKIVSPDIVHKSDVGGVVVGVSTDEVQTTYDDLIERTEAHDADARILGVRVESEVELADSTETIVGATRDAQFGPLVLFGLGGIFVQVFEDTAVRVTPVTEAEAREMTEEIDAAPMLRGTRGRPPADIDAVVEVIQRISQLVTDVPAISELDVNPLVVGPGGVCAVDFRMTLDPER